jgi:hypothetical protein
LLVHREEQLIRLFLTFVFLISFLAVGCGQGKDAEKSAGTSSSVSPNEARSMAKDASIYGVPTVDQDKVMYAFSIDKTCPQYKGRWNTILNIARVFMPKDTAFVTPNSDTPYSFAGLDLRAEPMVILVPKIEKNRYFVFQLMDLYTFNFAYIGSLLVAIPLNRYLLNSTMLKILEIWS